MALGQARPAAALPDFAAKSILALGAEPRRVTAALMEPVEEVYRLVGWQTVELPPHTVPEECPAALGHAVRRLGRDFGIPLWDAASDRPRAHAAAESLHTAEVGQTVVVADLLPPLRVWIAGLSGGGSLSAAEQALAGALCHPVASYRPGARPSTAALAVELETLRPDAVVVVGGLEGAHRSGREQVLGLSRLVTDAAARLPKEDRPYFCFAGNGDAAADALAYWQRQTDGSECAQADNVFLSSDWQGERALRRILERRHARRSADLPSMQRLAAWLPRAVPLRSAQWGFAQAVRIWLRRRKLPALHGLHAGADRWLHVWAALNPGTGDESLRLCTVPPGHRPDYLSHWPPLRMVSGGWPDCWRRPSRHWWDRSGLAPVVAGAGQAAPEAALQVLEADLLISGGGPTVAA